MPVFFTRDLEPSCTLVGRHHFPKRLGTTELEDGIAVIVGVGNTAPGIACRPEMCDSLPFSVRLEYLPEQNVVHYARGSLSECVIAAGQSSNFSVPLLVCCCGRACMFNLTCWGVVLCQAPAYSDFPFVFALVRSLCV